MAKAKNIAVQDAQVSAITAEAEAAISMALPVTPSISTAKNATNVSATNNPNVYVSKCLVCGRELNASGRCFACGYCENC